MSLRCSVDGAVLGVRPVEPKAVNFVVERRGQLAHWSSKRTLDNCNKCSFRLLGFADLHILRACLFIDQSRVGGCGRSANSPRTRTSTIEVAASAVRWPQRLGSRLRWKEEGEDNR
jgi:hypothetical protein